MPNILDTMVIFGATGDLTTRYLLPALVELRHDGKLPKKFRILGVANQGWNEEKFRQHILAAGGADAAVPAGNGWRDLLTMAEYRKCNATNAGEIAELLKTLNKPFVAYFALPPALFETVTETFSQAELPEGSRLVFEKPFGLDSASARNLNKLLSKILPENAVFRIDHFLHKQTVQNILGLRFANRIFEPIWNSHHIEHVEIVWDEDLSLEGRASYYDGAGALRDMIQNHLLQLMTLVAMEAPLSLTERSLRDRKVDVLRAVRRLSTADACKQTLRGRYTSGRIDGRSIPAYVDEPGVKAEHNTETFAEIVLFIDNWRWAGVPFTLRSGKALRRKRKDIAIYFKPVPHMAFGQGDQPRPNVLRLQTIPDRMALQVDINGPGDPFALEPAELDTSLAPQKLSPYARLLFDVIEGDSTLSIRDDEAEESWRIIEPILQAWHQNQVPLLEYPAGSCGPERKN